MGGSMGVTQGMLQEFGADRVRNTPISEMAIVGAGIGAAMQGMRPIVEIMYQDFTTLAMEQIVNQAAKHRYMSGGQLSVPLTIRTQGGAGWSPGAQHAQQLEAWFVHVPGLKVAFPSTPVDARNLLWSSIYDDNPVSSSSTGCSTRSRGRCPRRPSRSSSARRGAPRGHGRHRRRDRPARPRVAEGGRRGRRRGHLRRGLGSADAPAARRGVTRHVGCEDPPLRRRARGRDAHGLGRRGGRHRPGTGLRRARRTDRAGPDRSSRPLPFAPVMEQYVVPHQADVLAAIRRTVERSQALNHGHRGHAAPARPGDGVGHDRALAEGRGRHGRSQDEPLYELDTEKVTQEVECRVRVSSSRSSPGGGEEIEVGKPICVIGEAGEEITVEAPPAAGAGGSARGGGRGPRAERRGARARAVERARARAGRRPPLRADTEPSATDQPAGNGGGRIKASPLARRIAKERGIDLRRVLGHGARREDRRGGRRAGRGCARPGRRSRYRSPRAAKPFPLTSVRRTIARRLTEAWQAPHFAISMTADMTRSIELRERLVELTPEGEPRPTYSDMLTKICAAALLRHPGMNAHYEGDQVRLFRPRTSAWPSRSLRGSSFR